METDVIRWLPQPSTKRPRWRGIWHRFITIRNEQFCFQKERWCPLGSSLVCENSGSDDPLAVRVTGVIFWAADRKWPNGTPSHPGTSSSESPVPCASRSPEKVAAQSYPVYLTTLTTANKQILLLRIKYIWCNSLISTDCKSIYYSNQRPGQLIHFNWTNWQWDWDLWWILERTSSQTWWCMNISKLFALFKPSDNHKL